MAAYFAASIDLAGINAFAHDYLVNESLIAKVRAMDLLAFAWDGKLTAENILKLKAMKANGLIYDL